MVVGFVVVDANVEAIVVVAVVNIERFESLVTEANGVVVLPEAIKGG